MEKIINYALVTGASQGLGRAYSIDLAERGIPVLLVSKKNEGLAELTNEIRSKYGVAADFYEADFTDSFELQNFVEWVKSNYNISILINNVGMGGSVAFRETPFSYLNTIIQLNIKAFTYITHQLTPLLIQSGTDAYILNVSSMAAFCPMGYKSVYPATKKFIQHFSTGLRFELADSNVTVATVFPGPMKTNDNVTKRIEKQGAIAKLSLQAPESVARISLDKLFDKRCFIIVGLLNKINWLLLKIIPTGFIVPLLSNTIKKEITFKNLSHATV